MGKSPQRTLTQLELNRALLARQLLLQRVKLPLPRALERVGGIQAQYAPSMYIGLWSRISDFERAKLTRALERRSVVQGTLMRATIHLVSARDYWPFEVGIRDERRKWWLRVSRHPGAQSMTPAAKKLHKELTTGPLRRREIEELVGKEKAAGIGMWLDLIRVPPSGTWEQRRADLYGAAEDWIGPENTSPKQGIELLVRRYLTGFGPATKGDIANWAGLSVAQLGPALESIRLRRFQAEDGKELVDLPRAPLPDPKTPAPVRFLPVWDASLLVHARRTGILPEEYRPLVFNTKTPHSVPTFIVDGSVRGIWREEKGRIKLEPFEPLPKKTKRDVEAEADRLSALFG
jgi:hypothetical protein